MNSFLTETPTGSVLVDRMEMERNASTRRNGDFKYEPKVILLKLSGRIDAKLGNECFPLGGFVTYCIQLYSEKAL